MAETRLRHPWVSEIFLKPPATPNLPGPNDRRRRRRGRTALDGRTDGHVVELDEPALTLQEAILDAAGLVAWPAAALLGTGWATTADQRTRVEVTHLVTHSGRHTAILTLGDGIPPTTLHAGPDNPASSPIGRMSDALLRVVGAPTPPPTIHPSFYWAWTWLQRINLVLDVKQATAALEPVTFDDLLRVHPLVGRHVADGPDASPIGYSPQPTPAAPGKRSAWKPLPTTPDSCQPV